MNYWQYQDQPKRKRWHRGDNQRNQETAPAGESQLSLFDVVQLEQPEIVRDIEQPTDEEFANWLDEWD